MRKALVIDEKDNVATALQDLKEGLKISVNIKGKVKRIKLRYRIPFCHKFALQRIEKGGNVTKYGQVIGRATEEIQQGEYVHVHNVESLRGRGDIE